MWGMGKVATQRCRESRDVDILHLPQSWTHGSAVSVTICLLTGCYGAAQRAETQHEGDVLQDLSGHAGAVSAPCLQVPGLRAGVLPRSGAGAEKVREDRVECVL